MNGWKMSNDSYVLCGIMSKSCMTTTSGNFYQSRIRLKYQEIHILRKRSNILWVSNVWWSNEIPYHSMKWILIFICPYTDKYTYIPTRVNTNIWLWRKRPIISYGHEFWDIHLFHMKESCELMLKNSNHIKGHTTINFILMIIVHMIF